MRSLFSCLIVFLVASVSFQLTAQNYEVEQVSVAPYEKSFTRAGKVAFKRTLKLSFKSSGYLKKLLVDEGDFFDKGQLLASLNTEELKAAKNTRYIALLQAKRELARVKQLLDKKLGSQQDLDLAQTAIDTKREAYQVAYYNLEKAEIYAPFDGVVLARHGELSEFQSPGKEIVEVAAIENNLVVKVSLTDKEISFVKHGQVVKVRLANLGVVDGVITKIPVVSNTEGQQYLIEVLLKNITAGSGIVAGQLAQVDIDFVTEKFVYKVPLSALVEMDASGQAILLTQVDKDNFLRQAFKVLNVDNQYLYLNAQSQNQAIEIVTSGWQQLNLGEPQ